MIYLLPLACTALILQASTPAFGASETAGRLAWWWFFFWPDSPPWLFQGGHWVIRKMAHLTEYALLALSWLVCWQIRLRALPRWCWIWATLWGLLVAVLDETHQSFWLSRTGTWSDVWIDMVGVGCGLWILAKTGRFIPWI